MTNDPLRPYLPCIGLGRCCQDSIGQMVPFIVVFLLSVHMCSVRLICEQYRGRASCTTSLPAPLGSGGNAQSSLPAFIFWSSCLSTSSCWPRPGGSPGNTQTSAHHRRAREHESTQKTIVDRMAALPAPGAGARAHFWQGGYTSGGAGERGRLHPGDSQDKIPFVLPLHP